MNLFENVVDEEAVANLDEETLTRLLAIFEKAGY